MKITTKRFLILSIFGQSRKRSFTSGELARLIGMNRDNLFYFLSELEKEGYLISKPGKPVPNLGTTTKLFSITLKGKHFYKGLAKKVKAVL